jgi:hypothetical protein
MPRSWPVVDDHSGLIHDLQAAEDRDIFYVMAIRCSDTLTTPAGEQRADALIAAVPARAWQMISAGAAGRRRCSRPASRA